MCSLFVEKSMVRPMGALFCSLFTTYKFLSLLLAFSAALSYFILVVSTRKCWDNIHACVIHFYCYLRYPEWLHRQGGCLASEGCRGRFPADAALIYTM